MRSILTYYYKYHFPKTRLLIKNQRNYKNFYSFLRV